MSETKVVTVICPNCTRLHFRYHSPSIKTWTCDCGYINEFSPSEEKQGDIIMLKFKEYKGFDVNINCDGAFVASRIGGNEYLVEEKYSDIELRINELTKTVFVPVVRTISLISLEEKEYSKLEMAEISLYKNISPESQKEAMTINQKQTDALMELNKLSEEICDRYGITDDTKIREE